MKARALLAWAAVPSFVLLLAYLPDIGHGFIKDDFAWIESSRFEGPWGWLDLFRRHNGFYRPIVSLSFAADDRVHGLNPGAYAYTNLCLVFGSAVAVAGLARALRMPWGAALLAAAFWSLNFHGVPGALMWISGRTSLLATLFALAAAIASSRGRPTWAAAACLLALLSKEEAVLLPAVLALWAGWAPGEASFDRRQAARRGAVLASSLLAYFSLRLQTAAYLPWSAPWFYRPTFAPAVVARNILEYTDRGATVSAAGTLAAITLLRRWPRLDPVERRWASGGLLWFVAGYAPTVFLPVRSSLYAVLPSVGAALAGAAFVHASWRQAEPATRRRALVAAGLLPFLLVPAYRARNARMVSIADFSAQAVAEIGRARADIAAGHALRLWDRPGTRRSLEAAFGALAPSAVRLATGVEHPIVWIEPPPAGWESSGFRPPGAAPVVEMAVQNGRLVRR